MYCKKNKNEKEFSIGKSKGRKRRKRRGKGADGNSTRSKCRRSTSLAAAGCSCAKSQIRRRNIFNLSSSCPALRLASGPGPGLLPLLLLVSKCHAPRRAEPSAVKAKNQTNRGQIKTAPPSPSAPSTTPSQSRFHTLKGGHVCVREFMVRTVAGNGNGIK